MRKESRQVDPGVDLSTLRINARDAVVHPDVGVDLPLDVFEFVELKHIAPIVLNRDQTLNLECVGVNEPNPAGAVTHNQGMSVARESPTLARIVEFAKLIERIEVVNEPPLRLPGKLVQTPVEQRQALGEELGRHFDLLQNLSGLEFDAAKRRRAVQARAFIKGALMKDQTLSEGSIVVRISLDHFISVGRDSGRGCHLIGSLSFGV